MDQVKTKRRFQCSKSMTCGSEDLCLSSNLNAINAIILMKINSPNEMDIPKEKTFYTRLFAVEGGTSGSARISDEGDFQIPFKNTVQKAAGIQLVNYSIPWSWFNCTTTTNTLIYTDGGVQKTIRIPVGQYNSISSLCSAISEAMTLASSCVYTIAASPITQLLTFTGTKAFTISHNSTIKHLIGLGDTDLVANGSFIATAPNTFNLLPISELYIQLPGIVRNLELAFDGSNASCVSSVSLSSFSYGSYMAPSESGEIFRFDAKSLSDIVIRIVDGDGYTPEFDPKLPINMTWKLLYF